MKKDFNNYLKSKGFTSCHTDKYFNNIQNNLNPNILSNNDMQIDVFSKLLEDNIIFLHTEIDDYVCNIIKAQLLYLESVSNDDVNLMIDSPGGNIYAGLGLLDIMDYIKNDISTINTGLAASMGAVLLCSGTKGKRKAFKRSRTMIHQPLGGGWAQQASDMEIELNELNSLKKELYEIISENTGKSVQQVSNDSDRDYWMTSKDAKKYGMIDKILSKRK
jgi:ATP-dependent Clp protease protease subunit